MIQTRKKLKEEKYYVCDYCGKEDHPLFLETGVCKPKSNDRYDIHHKCLTEIVERALKKK